MSSFSAWLVAFRLRTLPLALSSIILGSFLAAYHQRFSWDVFILAVLTTLFLQILSNLANDYGDAVKGVDNAERLGPKRGLQAGDISLQQMKKAIVLFATLSLVSGLGLLGISSHVLGQTQLIIMLLLGVGAIIAAIKYTVGKNPYGYAGFGDLFVFIFFGLIGVLGVFFLYTGSVSFKEWLPAISVGLFSVGVLNMNNTRDRENDKAHGKNTMAVILGGEKIKIYHYIILLTGMITAIIYSLLISASVWKWIYLLSFVLIIKNMLVVYRNENPSLLDPELKHLALATLLFSVLFGVGLLI